MTTILQIILSWIVVVATIGIPALVGALCMVAMIVADTETAREAGVGIGN